MIILISGATCTGKTLLSKKLLENHKITYYSIDHLKMGLYRAYTNCGFTPSDDDELIGEKLWPILKGIIMTAIENGQDLIIEGAYIFPKYLREFELEYMKHILPIFICFTENYIKSNYETGIIKYRNAVEDRGYEEGRSPDIFIEDHKKIMEKCEEEKSKYFIIKSNYELEMEQIYIYIKKYIETDTLSKCSYES